MSKFNLLDEKWIKVVDKKSNQVVEVSLKEVFEHAHELKMLAGEMKTQDFAMLRLLLAVLHTVFSRFNANGEVYEFLEVDERYRQKEDVSEDDLEEYRDELMDTWKTLWKSGEFPKIVVEYLEKWRDRFYLFDEKYPFYQVTKEEMYRHNFLANGKSTETPGEIYARYINMLITESKNKLVLFSPKIESNKDTLSKEEIARFLIMLQGYVGGEVDKVTIAGRDYIKSKGWLSELGGVYLEGDTLFRTLMLNLILLHPKQKYILKAEKPCWEVDCYEYVENSFSESIDNISQLYTNLSRAVYIDVTKDLSDKFKINTLKLPKFDIENNLESMTIWKGLKKGNKNIFVPEQHDLKKSLWHNFGLVTESKDGTKRPYIIDWREKIEEYVDDNRIIINSVGMELNNKSNTPKNEVFDRLILKDFLLFDDEEGGWTVRINDIIEETKSVIEKQYKFFLKDIKEIRNYSNDGFVNNKIEELYSLIDEPFRNWIFEIDETSKKDESIIAWRKIFKKLLVQSAQDILNQSNPRDLKGIKKEDKIKNVPMAYNTFEVKINSILG